MERDTWIISSFQMMAAFSMLILGRDPKQFPPPMRLCKEMVEAMGGAESHNTTEGSNHTFAKSTIFSGNQATLFLSCSISWRVPLFLIQLQTRKKASSKKL